VTKERKLTDKLVIALAGVSAGLTIATHEKAEPKVIDKTLAKAKEYLDEATDICAQIRTELAKL
jgi:hypothetical protein